MLGCGGRRSLVVVHLVAWTACRSCSYPRSNRNSRKQTYLRAFKAKHALEGILASEVAARDESVAAIKAAWAERGKHRDGNIITDTMGDTERNKYAANEISSAHKLRMGKIAEKVAELRAEIAATRTLADEAKKLWHSPLSRLMTSTLASERRATLGDNLSRAGASEVELNMRLAMDTADADMAAACCARYEGLSKDARKGVSINRDDLAHALVADEWDEARKSMGMTLFALSTAELAIKDILGQKITSGEKIRTGLHRAELEADFGADNINPDKPPVKEEVTTTLKLGDKTKELPEPDVVKFTRLLEEDPAAGRAFGLEKGFLEVVTEEGEPNGTE